MREMQAEGWTDKVTALEAFQVEVKGKLAGLPYIQRDVLWRHYIKAETWECVRRQHYYSERQIRNIGNQGLKALGAALKGSAAVQAIFQDVDTI